MFLIILFIGGKVLYMLVMILVENLFEVNIITCPNFMYTLC